MTRRWLKQGRERKLTDSFEESLHAVAIPNREKPKEVACGGVLPNLVSFICVPQVKKRCGVGLLYYDH